MTLECVSLIVGQCSDTLLVLGIEVKATLPVFSRLAGPKILERILFLSEVQT